MSAASFREGEHFTLLARRGAVEQAEPEPIRCHEVLAELGTWADWHRSPGYGHDACRAWLVRACDSGRLRLLVRREWVPAPGYSASGTEDELYELPEAVRLGEEVPA
ncbi:MAG TPA: hypothetical protein VNO86_05075 [Candidatus Binatia bacterium]|nr:hypothetical protein [Candidatus Binatia bacterium]